MLQLSCRLRLNVPAEPSAKVATSLETRAPEEVGKTDTVAPQVTLAIFLCMCQVLI